MPTTPRVVIIGAGIVGANLADELTARGWGRVTEAEARAPVGSHTMLHTGSTPPRAVGTNRAARWHAVVSHGKSSAACEVVASWRIGADAIRLPVCRGW